MADAGPGFPHTKREMVARSTAWRGVGPPIPGMRFVVHEWRLARRLAALRPTLLHAHDTNALVPVARRGEAPRIPYVYDAHDLWLGRPRRQRGRLYFSLSQAYYRLVERCSSRGPPPRSP